MPDFVLDHEPTGFARIKVVGVGGGGCNAVDSMFDIGLQNVEFYVVNSDLQALKRSKCPNRIQIGAELTQGRGCGAEPRLGEACMLEAKEEMMETLQGADIVFVTSGLGGGTGTGAAPVVAQIAKELGILTVAVVTKPFKFEGPRRMKSAVAGLDKLRDAADTLIAINNDRLLDVAGAKVPIQEAFKIADNVLAQAVSSISDLVATTGLINVDFNDIRTIMGGKGGAVMGVGVGKGENRSAEAVKKATNSPLLDKIVIDGATGVLICITGGSDMTLNEVNEATHLVHEAADPDAEIIFGAVVDESLNDQLRITIIATGFPDEMQRRIDGREANQQPQPQQQTLVPQEYRERYGNQQLPPQAAPPAPAPRHEPTPQPRYSEQPSQVNGHYAQQPQQQAPPPQPQPQPQPQAYSEPAPQQQQAPQQPAAQQQQPRPDSLRDTLERMRAEQGQAGPGQQQPAAKQQSSSTNGSHPPGVRSASQPNVRPAREEPAPQVSLFDPSQEEEKEAANTRGEFDKPAFLRRRRSLFE